MACTLRVIPEPGSGRELELGSGSRAEPLRCPASSGWPGSGNDLREVRPKSQVASCLSQPGWDFWLPGSKPMAHGAGLACGLSCRKRNLGSWSALRDAVLFKAELTLRQHLQTARVTQQGRWWGGGGLLSGWTAGFSLHVSPTLQGWGFHPIVLLPGLWPGVSTVKPGAQTRPVVHSLVAESSQEATELAGDHLQASPHGESTREAKFSIK